MEDLVLEQPAFREAQRVADDYFRLAMATPRTGSSSGGSIHSREFSLLSPGEPANPTFVQLTASLDDDDALVNQEGLPPFFGKALRSFVAHPKREHSYTTVLEGDRRQFLYAHMRSGLTRVVWHVTTSVARVRIVRIS